MTDEERKAAAVERYNAACHAIQTGVALEHARGGRDGSPKHLRVGINLRAVDHAALVRLLIDRGVFTQLEYFEALADQAEIEKADYEQRLGPGIHLG